MYYLKQGNVITLIHEEDSKYESDTSINSSKTSINMDSIMKRLFTLKNKKPIIDFLYPNLRGANINWK